MGTQRVNNELSVRIVTADYYLHKPIPQLGDPCYSGFRSLPIYRVPIIRIFGPTSEGVKTCVHVHGVFPYIFIPNWNNEIKETDLYHFAAALDKAINVSFARSNSTSSQVFKITQVSGRPFYGYHEGEKNFLKIELYNPAMVKRTADLLLNGAVFNTKFQPHEAHVPYILQFFIDNNLYGMNNITFSSCLIRKDDHCDTEGLNESLIFSSSTVPKQSYSKLEVDVTISQLNAVSASGENMPNNPGLAFIWEEEKKRRKQHEKSSQITPNTSQQRPKKIETAWDTFFSGKLNTKLKLLKDSNSHNAITLCSQQSTSSSQELNSQSKNILLLLEDLVEKQRRNRLTASRSRSSSPSLVYSDNEDPVANISAISFRPVLKFNAESDSILGNNFSDEENDIDEHDHKALSQSMIYMKHEHTSSSDESENGDFSAIPQLDGAHGDSDLKPKRRGRPQKIRNHENIQSNERLRNLRSSSKRQKPLTATDFKPRDFKIILDRLDLKFSPKKTYPKLNVNTQKSPKLTNSQSSEFSPKSASSTSGELSSLSPRENLSPKDSTKKSDNRFPQLEVSIKKSPKSHLGELSKIKNVRSRIKKRKIDFMYDYDFVQRQKISLKKQKSDTCFKIKDSLSLAQFGKSRPNSGKKCNSDSKIEKKQSSKICSADDIDNVMISLCKSNNDMGTNSSERSTPRRLDFNELLETLSSSLEVELITPSSANLDPNEKAIIAVSDVVDSEKERLQVSKEMPLIGLNGLSGGKSYLEDSNIQLDVNKSHSELNCSDRDASSEMRGSNIESLKSNIQICDTSSSSKAHKTSIINSNIKSIGNCEAQNLTARDKKIISETKSESAQISTPTKTLKTCEIRDLTTLQSERISLETYFEAIPISAPRKNSEIAFSDDDSFMLMLDDEPTYVEKSRKCNEEILNFENDDMESLRISDEEDVMNSPPVLDKSDNVATLPAPQTSTLLPPKSDLRDTLHQSQLISQDINTDEVATLPSILDSSDYVISPERAFPTKISKFAKSLVSQQPSKIRQNILDESNIEVTVTTSPNILDQENIQETSQVENTFRLEISPETRENSTTSQTQGKKPSVNLLPLNNSIWDPASDEENPILSFYDDVDSTMSNFTQIQNNSSPVASAENNEILSFYGSQSPSGSITWVQNLEEVSQKSGQMRNSQLRKDESLTPPMLHSTPKQKSKKSPSPTYTPILRKMVLKRNKEKSTISSQRFHSEPFLPEIREEEEKNNAESEKNTTLSLPITSEKIKPSSLNTSHCSTFSGASCEIDGATLDNTHGFKMELENLQNVKMDKQHQYITLISMELFVKTRGDLKPDPEYDSVNCLFYSIFHDVPCFPKLISGLIVVNDDEPLCLDIHKYKCDKKIVASEVELFEKFVSVIRKWDPDMCAGYEIEMLSWGFFIQRGYFLGKNYCQELSRVLETGNSEIELPVIDEDDHSNELKLPGRIILNVWRLMRHEVSLQSYTFENIMFHVMHQRLPSYSFKFLTECWTNKFKRWIVFDYYILRTECNITILDQLDFVGRTSELARLFGIQFYEVLSRGSQFRVESMMLRLAKTQNYVAVSPSVKQRAEMRAPESLPLIMEPESKFYTDPVIVLDFQSLYPSIIIAYNYCFSTCLGRVESLAENQSFNFGCVEHFVPTEVLLRLESFLNFSPSGVAFVNENIRKGILPTMLEEILETRLMVKKSLKENKSDNVLKRVLHARQLGLKLIANVTYGYTSANFSGRMPCIEIGDSVVSKGRETLERAIEMVKNTEKWGARVVYGDTDSLFVMVPNRSKEEAFKIGAEIAEAVTNANPKPVKLKLEKVYLPSILQTKKRYVGYMYEAADQEKPVYDAKGIETVRRDGCPAISKILEKSLKLLFVTKNITTVKQYVQRQFSKIISGRISIQELTFAREYRGMSNYRPAACVPALQLAKQALLKDRRAEPRIKERVRYVITAGPPGVPLIKLVRTPEEFLETPGSLINTEYYITRAIIPALDRCFSLMNANTLSWYNELPRKQRLNLPINYDIKEKSFKKRTISHYFSSSKCLSCSKVAGSSICRQCQHKPQRIALILGNMISNWQRKHNDIAKICRSCSGGINFECSSLDCPIYYLYKTSAQEMEQVKYAEELKQKYLYF